ncbi:MAG TPA: hypothetical protein VFW48_04110 [Solirubrobacterales bacterium]|nr:hypothetical protein [Solirubrobacterales bacterium]
MASSSRLARAAVLTVLLAIFPAGAAGASPESETVVQVELDLPASNGLHAHLETSEDEDVTLMIWRKEHGVAEGVVYEVPGEVDEAGLRVRFGRLGSIDVAFTPTTTLDATEVSPGCTGAPRTLREGVFAGTIAFAGERGYVRIEAPQVEGSMSVFPHWQCPEEDSLNPFESIPGVPELSARPAGRKRESASLAALNRDFSRFFGAGVHHRHSGGRSIFYGAQSERRERMKIARTTSALGPASAFDYDHEAGTASLDPPPPLKGHAAYRARYRGHVLWRSTIQVPLLGAAPLKAYGPDFGVLGLYPEYQFD